VEVVRLAQFQGEDFASLAVLRRYQGWRQWENLMVLAFTDVLTRMFSNQIWPLVRVRRLGLWGLNHVPLVKPLALRLMLGLTGRVPQLARQTATGLSAPAQSSMPDSMPDSMAQSTSPLPTPANL
jgi:2-octaprenyl-6-methoxyphenol hydroxylase